MNIWKTISCFEIRRLRKNDEYGFSQLVEHLSAINCRRCLTFSCFQFLIGVLFFIVSFLLKNFGVFTAVGSVSLIASSVFFLLYYKSEFGGRKQEFSRPMFYIFWSIFTIGGFLISADFYINLGEPFIYLLFFASVVAVPVFDFAEITVATIVYALPMFFYGVHNKFGIVFYLCELSIIAVFFWINSLKIDSCFKEWNFNKRLKDILDRNKMLSSSDNLTGMLNRIGLTERIKKKYPLSNTEHNIAVIAIDIDNFRFYNHKYGYERSDSCMYNIGNCIRIISKPVTDMVARLDGDRFAVVLEDMNELEVVKFAEQIRFSLETMAIPLHENQVLTVSVGISEVSDIADSDTFLKLLNHADLQVLVAKKNGKNCIGYRNRAFIQEN